MRLPRERRVDRDPQGRRAGQLVRRSAVYVSGCLIGLVAAGLATLLIDGTAGKLAVWAAVLFAVSFLWGAGATIFAARVARRRPARSSSLGGPRSLTARSGGTVRRAGAGRREDGPDDVTEKVTSRWRSLRVKFPGR